MPVTASYSPGTFTLSVLGTSLGETMTIERDVAGALRINGGAVAISGGSPTVANTSLITAAGGDGNDTLTIDEANGAMPAAELYGGNGDDTLTGGSAGDTLTGEANNDILLGRGGIDQLFGGVGNDTLTGGDGNDSMFGEDGDDRMIWNAGDDNDLMEGGIGSDTAEVNGGNGDEAFTITANGTRVRFDRINPAPFTLDIGTTEALVINANGGNDTISTSGNLAALISLTIDGGAGNDTILGGNGIDTLLGGDGSDFVDGNQGNDVAFLGADDDIFNWDPGDGSDIVEGGSGTDTLTFNASAANEIIDVTANGARTQLARNVGAIVMDLNDLEKITLNALGGVDVINVNDLTGTDATQVDINLAGTIGGSSGDAAADTVTVNGSAAANTISIIGAGTSVSITGLPALVNITNAEGANDALTVNGQGDNDTIIATTVPAGVIKLTLDGGAGNDTLNGSQGADTFFGGDGADFVFGDNGNDVAFLGNGDDVFQWDPGDGNDTIEGQANFDELRFNGSNASENYNIAANGGRLLLARDVANVTTDMDDVEKIRINLLGGNDTIIVGDLTGTDATSIDLRLGASGGGGDGGSDSVTVNGTNGTDTINVTASGGVVTASGLQAAVSLTDAEVANDRLTINGNGGDDTINAGNLAAGLIQLTINGGLGNDLMFGSAGNDIVNGGDGNDTALLGAGDDIFTWNPGDDNDVVEGQAGTDTLQFNGANIAETINILANGARTTFFRDVANVFVDMNDTEVIRFAALGGADTITVNDLSATDVTQLVFDLASTIGGPSGDAQVDTITLNGSADANTINLSGTAAALVITGLPYAVTLNVVETTDRLIIQAGEGDDTLSATGIATALLVLTLDGGGGSDVIRSTGDGTYLGGTGDDLIFAGLTNSSEVLDGGIGVDTLDTTSWAGPYTLNMVTGVTNYSGESFVNFENLVTGDGDDTITGTTGANIIRTNAGIDNVTAGDGDDTVEGGAGGDTLNGGVGNDTVDYSSSNAAVTVSLNVNSASGGHATGDIISNFENLSGSAFNDFLTGNGLANIIIGGLGADTMSGLTGDDFYFVDNAGDVVVEVNGAGTDTIYTSINYTLANSVFVEKLSAANNSATTPLELIGNDQVNELYGNVGANFLDGGAGADFMQGYGGNDTYIIDNAGDAVSDGIGEGRDVVYIKVDWVMTAGAEIEVLSTISQAATTPLSLTGNALRQEIYGNAGANFIDGTAGNPDYLSGLGGNDTYIINNGSDFIFETAGGGRDVVYCKVSFTLTPGAEIEVLSVISQSGGVPIDLTGNTLFQELYGNTDSNFLDGGAGADYMQGFTGNDNYIVDVQADTIVEGAGEGARDTVFARASYVLGAGVQVEVMSTISGGATTAINLTGNEFANELYGNAGANVLNGGLGGDYLQGFGGADSFAFTTALGGGNIDQIADFLSGTDKIQLDDAIFTQIGALGGLNPNAFVVGTAAADLSDRIIYNNATGQLFYDADGTGGTAAVQFATLLGNPAISASDFQVI